MPRLTKIYTRKGDEGYTQLRGETLSKDDLLVAAIGDIDELNSVIGFLLAQEIKDQDVVTVLTQVQNELFDMGGEMHVPEHPAITADKVTHLEEVLDAWNKTLPSLKEFILPRGNNATAACHVARTVARRAERSVVKLHRQVNLHNMEILRYLNRLSDLLFVIARILGREDGTKEIMWEHEKTQR